MTMTDGIGEIEFKCKCGRKIKIKFLMPIIIEQTSEHELRGEDAY